MRSRENFGNFGAGGCALLVADMLELSRIAIKENPAKPLILLGHSMGSFAAQQFVLDHSGLLDGLILSGTGALDGLIRLTNSSREKYSFLNAKFVPARTPYDWLSRDAKVIDAFMSDPLCFPTLTAASTASLLAAAAPLADATRLAAIRRDLPVYFFFGSEDPVGERLAGVRTLIDRYRHASISNISLSFYDGGRHEMLNEINRGEVRANLLAWIAATIPT